MSFHFSCHYRCLWLLGVLLGYFLGGGTVWAQGSLEAPASVMKPFRRVYVPETLLDEIPTRGQGYWPIRAEEFEQCVKARQNSSLKPGGNHAVYSDAAHYTAILRLADTLEGEAVVRLNREEAQEAPKESERATVDPVFWRFDTISFALDESYGIRLEKAHSGTLLDRKKTVSSETATMPVLRELRFSSAGYGEFQLYPTDFQEDLRNLTFHWSQKCTLKESERMTWWLDFLPSTDVVLDVVVPPRWIPSMEHGIAERLEHSDKDPLEGEWVTWRFHLGGQRSVELRLVSADAETRAPAPEPPAALSQETTYQFTRKGLDVTCRMTLDRLVVADDSKDLSGTERSTLELQMGEGLLLTSARMEDTSLKWSYTAEKTVILELPTVSQTESGAERTLELHAIYAGVFYTGPQAKPVLRTLPKIVGRGTLWRDARTVVETAEPLEVVDWKLKDAVLQRNYHLENEVSKEGEKGSTDGLKNRFRRLEFLESTDNSEIWLALRNPPAAIALHQATAVDFQENGMAAMTEITAAIGDGECFELWGLVERSWTIDIIESDTPGLVEDWQLVSSEDEVTAFLSERGYTLTTATATETGKRLPAGRDVADQCVLRIQLSRSLRPERSVSFRIRARRVVPEQSNDFTAADLAPAFFPDYANGDSWILIGTTYPWRMSLLEPYQSIDFFSDTNEETLFLTISPLLSQAQAFFPTNSHTLVAHQDFKSTPMLRLERQARIYHGTVNVFYNLSRPPSAICRLTCDPQGSVIDRVLVQVRPAAVFGVTWNFPKRLAGSEAVCLEPSDGMESNAQQMAELWEVRLKNPQREPFTLEVVFQTQPDDYEPSKSANQNPQAWWKKHFSEGLFLPLVSLPDAATCTASVSVRRDISSGLNLQPQDMTPIFSPVEKKPTGPTEGIWTYRYEPQALMNTMAPWLKILWRDREKPAPPSAWIWRQEVQSQFFPNGVSLHVVSMSVENVGEDFLHVTLPPRPREGGGLSLFSVLVNGRAVPISMPEDSEETSYSSGRGRSRLTIAFPPGRRHNDVVIQWIHRGSRLGVRTNLNMPDIRTNFPVLDSFWRAWVPENYVALDDRDLTVGPKIQDTVFLRFFGSLRFGRNVFTSGNREKTSEIVFPFRTTLDSVSEPTVNEMSRHTTAEWNAYTRAGGKSFGIIHGNAMEAVRWFNLLLFFWLFTFWFSEWRSLKIGICGASAALCLLLPLVYSPLFSGVFLGAMIAQALHSIRTYRQRHQEQIQKTIRFLEDDETSETSKSSRNRRIGLPRLLGIFVLFWGGMLFAQEPSLPETPWVFIPLDAQGKPTGTDYYLPLELFRTLYAPPTPPTSSAEGIHAGTVYHSVIYTGVLSHAFTPRDLIVESMNARFQIETVTTRASVRFPLRQEEVYLSPGSVRLDGIPQQVDWVDGELLVVVPEPGRHSLEIAFLPIPASQAEKGLSPYHDGRAFQTGFRFQVPRVANARMELQIPAMFTDVQFPTAIGKTVYDPQKRIWNVQLGAASEVAVQWKTPYAQVAETLVPVEELYRWKNLGSDNPEIDCRFRISSLEDGLAQFTWVMDARFVVDVTQVHAVEIQEIQDPQDPQETQKTLENQEVQNNQSTQDTRSILSEGAAPKPLENKRSRDASTSDGREPLAPREMSTRIPLQPTVQVVSEGAVQHLRLTFDPPPQGKVLVSFPLRMPHGGGVGNRLFPLVATEKSRIQRRWIAVQSDSNLSISVVTPGDAVPAAAVPDFLTAWNEFAPAGQTDTLSAPFRVLDDTEAVEPSERWWVHVQPPAEKTVLHDHLAILGDVDGLNIHYVVTANSPAAVPSLLHVQVPENLDIQDIIYHEGLLQRPLRFTRISSRLLGIFLEKTGTASSHSGDCQIVLTGRVDLTDVTKDLEHGQKTALPEIRIRDAGVRLTARTVSLYRTDQVLLRFQRSEKTLAPPELESISPSVITEETESNALLPDTGRMAFPNARLVGNWTLALAEELGGELTVRRNRPKIDLKARTTLSTKTPEQSSDTSRAAGASQASLWNVQLDMVLNITEGVSDELTILLPPDVQGPFTLEPPCPYLLESVEPENPARGFLTHSEDSEGEGTPESMRMVIRPSRALFGSVRLTLGCDVRPREADKETLVSLPAFHFPDLASVSQDVLLPAPSLCDPSNTHLWTTEGMIPVDKSVLPPPAITETVLTETNIREVYLVVDKNFGAKLQATSAIYVQPTARWVSHLISWGLQDDFLGLTTMNIDPEGSFECIIRLPDELEPMEFRLDSEPVQIQAVSEKETIGQGKPGRFYRIPFHSVAVVQRLEILYRGNSSRLAIGHIPGQGLPRNTDLSFRLRLPELYSVEAEAPQKSDNGTCFLLLPRQENVQFWRENAPTQMLTYRPVLRMELIQLEQVLAPARQIASHWVVNGNEVAPPTETAVSSGGGEAENWFRRWTPLWDYKVAQLKKRLSEDASPELREYRDELANLEKEGEPLFRRFRTSAEPKMLLAVFVRNLPQELTRAVAFDTVGESRFYLRITPSAETARPRFWLALCVTLFVTGGVLLGIRLLPSHGKGVRRLPIWLGVLGLFWIFSTRWAWIGYLLVLSGLVMILLHLHLNPPVRSTSPRDTSEI